MIWYPIKQLPDSYKDGRQLLLRFHKTCQLGSQTFINGWVVTENVGSDWWNTPVGFIGEPTHFCVFNTDFSNIVDTQ